MENTCSDCPANKESLLKKRCNTCDLVHKNLIKTKKKQKNALLREKQKEYLRDREKRRLEGEDVSSNRDISDCVWWI